MRTFCYKERRWFDIILLSILLSLFGIALYSTWLYAASEQIIRIEVNPIVPLHHMSKEEISRLRKAKIDKYSHLEIYSKTYETDKAIFGRLDERAEWLHDTQFFVANPYLLVLSSGGNYVNALLPFCQIDHVDYSHNRIDVKYRGNNSAKQWFYYIFNYYPDSRGVIRLWFVNALDAGFKYAHVDQARSMNIAPASKSGSSVADAVYSGHEFFHRGRSQKNNISPDDPNAKLRIERIYEKTVIFVKLWRTRPVDIHAKEDFAYVIDVDPGDKEPYRPE